MSLTLEQARDTVIGVVNDAWTASGAPSETLPMLFDNVAGDRPGEDGVTTFAGAWAGTTVRTLASTQSTQGSSRRYLTEGQVTVQVFTPVGDGHALGDQLSRVVLDALRGHSGNVGSVWFLDAVASEVGVDGPWFQVNVSAGFRFQELAP